MKTLNPHNLIDCQKKEIQIAGGVNDIYLLWKELFEEISGRENSPFDAFIAGYYIAGNIMLKEKYLKKLREMREKA